MSNTLQHCLMAHVTFIFNLNFPFAEIILGEACFIQGSPDKTRYLWGQSRFPDKLPWPFVNHFLVRTKIIISPFDCIFLWLSKQVNQCNYTQLHQIQLLGWLSEQALKVENLNDSIIYKTRLKKRGQISRK